MREVFLNSIYNVEPKSTISAWSSHWNYKWSGRNSSDLNTKIRLRKECGDIYLVQDKNGVVWRMSKLELDNFLLENCE